MELNLTNHRDLFFRFQDQLQAMFRELPDWDNDEKYIPGKLSVYFEDIDGDSHSVPLDSTLGSVLSDKR